MKVANYTEFVKFNYISDTSVLRELGDVVINNENEIGVIIQIHKDFIEEYRTDMFGNCCESEIRTATFGEVCEFRPNLKEYLL